jgi:hypothetical protein
MEAIMTNRINNNSRIVTLPCIECGRLLRFRIVNEVVVESEGRIVANVPCAVCPDCAEPLLDKVADPPGLICIDRLSPVLAREILQSFAFLLSRSEAFGFFAVLFPEIGYGEAELE